MKNFAAWTLLHSFLVANVAAQDPNAVLGSVTIPTTAVTPNPSGVSPVPQLVPTTAAAIVTVPAVTQAPNQGITFAPGFVNHESASASAFIDGFIMGYLKNVDLNPGEKTCLRDNVRKLGDHAVSMVKKLVTMVQGFIPNDIGNSGAAPGVFNGLSAVGEIMSIVSEVQLLGGGCVESDTMTVLNVSLKHLKNMTYVQSRFVANGIDILKVVADAAPQIHAGNYHGVGYDIGTIFRKLILSSNNMPIHLVLTNGMTREEVGPTILNGIIQGFFVTGSNLTVRLMGRSDVDIFMDLHRCIAKEAGHFTDALNALSLFIAEIATSIERWKLQSEGIQLQGPRNQMAWLGKLSGLMANVPILMNRCGMTPEQINAMGRAIDHFDKMHLTLGIPGPVGDRVSAGVDASKTLEEATKYWEAGKYLVFGELMGSMLRDLLLTVYPQLYSVDESGKLQWISQAKSTGTFSHFMPIFVGAFAAVSFIGLSLVRVASCNHRAASPLLDVEGSDIEAPGENHMAME